MNAVRSPLFRYFLMMAAGCALILGAEYLGMHEGMNRYCYDHFFRLRGMEEPDRRILIAAIDDQTLNRLGQWPLKRGYYAKLLDVLGAARMVGLDLLMTDPGPDDALLSEAIRGHGRVVLPNSIELSAPVSRQLAGEPVPTGHIHLEQDIDGVVRKVYHTVYRDGRSFPSFDSLMHDLVSSAPFVREDPSKALQNSSRFPDILQLDVRKINYLGPPGTFPAISLVDIIEERYPRAFFADRIVLVGCTANGLEKGIMTPFSQLRKGMSGVEVHANILNNLIHNNPVVDVPDAARVLFSFIFAFGGFLLFLRTEGRRLLLVWSAGMLVALGVSFLLLSLGQLWASPVLCCVALSFMAALAYLIKLEQAGNRLRAAEREWEDSFDAIGDGIALVDRNGAVTRMNAAARAMQAPRLLALLGNSPGAAGGGEGSMPSGGEEMTDPLTGNSFEIRTQCRSGEDGQSGGVVHVIRDITQARRLEQEKEQLRSQFLQAQKMESLGRLAGGVAHDFNNILTAIIGFSEMALTRAGHEPFLSEALTVIHDSGRKAAALVRQLLVFSRKNAVELQVVAIGEIVEDMAKMLGRVIGEDISLELRTHEPASAVLADPGQIEQIIMNLAVNARDAMPGGGTITIRVADTSLDEDYAASHPDVAPGRYVMLSVSDTGAGMSPEVQARIFEPFYTTKKAGDGTGLGLSTVYGIVSRFSGHIRVHSEVGRGTEFELFFPVSEASACEAAKAETDAPVGGGETILVVEDDASIRSLITSTLEPLGYTVLAASSAHEALSLAAQSGASVELLLTDVVMPGMGGRDLADILLRRYPDLRIIFMSGYAGEALDLRGVEHRRCHLVQKPLSPKVLAGKLRDVLDEGGCGAEAPPVC